MRSVILLGVIPALALGLPVREKRAGGWSADPLPGFIT